LITCNKVQRVVTREAVTAGLLAETGMDALDLNDQPTAANALAKVVALLARIRVALKPYGVALP
jgi:hypothetical protein